MNPAPTAEAVRPHPGPVPRGGWITLRAGRPEGGWVTPMTGRPEGGLGHTQGWASRGGGLRQWVRFAQRGRSLPPSARRTHQVEPRLRWPSRWEGAPPLGGKLSRSLRSLRPIAAASVVAGRRWFAGGAWIHPVLRTDEHATAAEVVRPHARPGISNGGG